MNKNKKTFIRVLIGAGILALLFYEVDIHTVVEALRGLNPILFGLAALAYLCYNLLMSYRLFYLLRKTGTHVSFYHSLFAHLA
ncbi:hypothetical protein CW714_09125, partial [Methanophagales archaeon]